MNIGELWDEITGPIVDGEVAAENAEYSVRVEVADCVEVGEPGRPGEKETLTITGARWDHNEGILVLETE
jgi:hypothetical protein